ncbi:MAG TPA: DinB family protein [Chitinophagales bacterium]|nr:DinB family protein [Chitinophagales bacterium]
MSTETARIKKLLSRNWDGPMWYGNNLTETLKNVSWQQAFKKPVGFKHNIYEYVMHLYCWRKFVTEYLQGNNTYTVELNSETDWVKNYEVTEANWLQAVADLQNSQTELMAAMELFSDDRLKDTVPGKKFNWYVMLHGLVHHDIYHSGQISLLKQQ